MSKPMTDVAEIARIICWYSDGAASAIAAKMTLRDHPNAVVAYCGTNAEHPDNVRFRADCVRWFNAPITVLQSDEYADTWDVWERRKFLSGIHGAPCTGELKLAPRLAFQRPDDIHVFGYTADAADVARATRLREHYGELTIRTPLIDGGIDKAACMALLIGAGIQPPAMYALGFHNNNCIPCVKATSPNYWSLVRREFPTEFARMVELSRRLDVRLTRIADVRMFIDEIPADWPCTSPIAPACDFLCHIAEQDFAA